MHREKRQQLTFPNNYKFEMKLAPLLEFDNYLRARRKMNGVPRTVIMIVVVVVNQQPARSSHRLIVMNDKRNCTIDSRFIINVYGRDTRYAYDIDLLQDFPYILSLSSSTTNCPQTHTMHDTPQLSVAYTTFSLFYGRGNGFGFTFKNNGCELVYIHIHKYPLTCIRRRWFIELGFCLHFYANVCRHHLNRFFLSTVCLSFEWNVLFSDNRKQRFLSLSHHRTLLFGDHRIIVVIDIGFTTFIVANSQLHESTQKQRQQQQLNQYIKHLRWINKIKMNESLIRFKFICILIRCGFGFNANDLWVRDLSMASHRARCLRFNEWIMLHDPLWATEVAIAVASESDRFISIGAARCSCNKSCKFNSENARRD